MTHVFYEVTESFSVSQMFALVNDIECYPDFVPDCIAAGVLSKQEIDQQHKLVKAFIEVEKLGFKKSFTTLNRINEPYSIEMQLIEGPFKKLSGAWNFTELADNCCKISFTLDFDFKNRLLDVAFTPIFKEIMRNMVNAFAKRAKQIYQ